MHTFAAAMKNLQMFPFSMHYCKEVHWAFPAQKCIYHLKTLLEDLTHDLFIVCIGVSTLHLKNTFLFFCVKFPLKSATALALLFLGNLPYKWVFSWPQPYYFFFFLPQIIFPYLITFACNDFWICFRLKKIS